MYQVVSVLDGIEHILMDLRDENYILENPRLTLQINSPGVFVFNVHPTHPEISSIVPLVSLIKVYKTDYKTYKKWMFTGRVTSDERDIYNTGKVKCEGILAYLMDSIILPYEYEGTPADYVRQLIAAHNSQVDTGKQFIIRTLDLADVDTNDNIVRANKNYPTTMQELKNKVIKLLDAYIAVEEIDGKLYIDCNQSILNYNTQDIRLGENIIDLKQSKSAAEIRTVMIGIGAEDKEGNSPTVMVEDDTAIARYGRIVGTVEFEDVTTIPQLTRKTKAYLDSIVAETNAVEIKAVDLNMTSPEIESIELGYCYVESEYNNLNHVRMLVSKMDIYLTQPGKNTFSLGAAYKSMTTSTSHANAEIDKRVKRIANSISPRIQYAVDNATQLITGAKGGYVILDCGEDAKSVPSQILIMDSPDKNTAKSVIRINKNGIGFSTTGYNGPYRNAWTIDGNLVADFITTGTMFADRIRGGTLLIGGTGSGRDGEIVVRDSNDNVIVRIDINGVDIRKGSIRGTVLEIGGYNNQDGSIAIKNSNGLPIITLNNQGIDVNNRAFYVDMQGNVYGHYITAFGIRGDAVRQFSQSVDDSEAMRVAKQAISAAQTAANNAANAAAKAQQTADDLSAHINNINEGVKKQNTWINQLSGQIQELGKPGIS